MIYWAPFLHFYQPPIQFHKVLRKIANESYRPLLAVLEQQANAKVTINMCGVLTEMLSEHNSSDILERIGVLAGKGRLEFVDSAKFHAILPLIPLHEMVRQIKLNRETNEHFFGKVYKPRGFFPPEMCYSNKVGSCIKGLGYEWVLLSGVAHPENWPLDFISSISRGQPGLKVFYRDDIISNKISFHELDSSGFVSALAGLTQGKKDIYVITAMDAETFGHHIRGWEKTFLAKVYETIQALETTYYSDEQQWKSMVSTHSQILDGIGGSQTVKVVTLSELLDIFPHRSSKPPRPSSWSTTKEDIANKNYYPLWSDRDNRIHQLQWAHMELCCTSVQFAENLKELNNEASQFRDIARGLLDKALHSCQFWWANKARGLWSVNLIYKGLLLQEEALLNAYKAIRLCSIDNKQKKEYYYKTVVARKIASDIQDLLVAD